MKSLKISLCFFIIVSLCACASTGEFHSLAGFIEAYNRTCEENIALSDFIISEKNTYTAFFPGSTLLQLKEDSNGKIESCTVALTRLPGTLPSTEGTGVFRELLANTLGAYCGFDRDEAREIISALSLDSHESFIKYGELTYKRDCFIFIYYSDKLTNQLTVYNSYLDSPEATSKPESKPYYGEDFEVKE